MSKLSETLQVEIAVDSADVDTSDVTSAAFYSVKNFRSVYAHAKTVTNLTVGKKLTLTLMQATDNVGTGAKILGTAAEDTAGGTEVGEVSADAFTASMDAAGGFTFVGVKVGTDLGSAVVASAVLVLGDAKLLPVE